MNPSERQALATGLAQCALSWPENEVRALALLANRIGMGLGQYGGITPGKKDWAKEAGEELADAWIYLAFRRVVG